jgi:hypothetical protein
LVRDIDAVGREVPDIPSMKISLLVPAAMTYDARSPSDSGTSGDFLCPLMDWTKVRRYGQAHVTGPLDRIVMAVKDFASVVRISVTTAVAFSRILAHLSATVGAVVVMAFSTRRQRIRTIVHVERSPFSRLD